MTNRNEPFVLFTSSFVFVFRFLVMLHIRETPAFPELFGRQLTHAYGMAAEMPLEREVFSLVPQRPPVHQLDSEANPLSDNGTCVSTMVPASSSGLAPTGTVGVSVLSTSFDPAVSFQTLPPAPIPTCTTPTLNPLLSTPSPQPDTSVRAPIPAGSLGTASSTGNSAGTPLNNHSAPYYLESRRWWSLALPSTLGKHLPLLRSGLLLQTCGHVVHRECFQRYRAQVSFHWIIPCAKSVHVLFCGTMNETANLSDCSSSLL